MFEPVRCTFLVENGKIWYDLVAKQHLKTSSFSNKPLSLGGEAVSKSFRLSTPFPVFLRKLDNNPCRINISASPLFTRPTKPETIGRQLGGKMAIKSFRLSKTCPALLTNLYHNPCRINRPASLHFIRPA